MPDLLKYASQIQPSVQGKIVRREVVGPDDSIGKALVETGGRLAEIASRIQAARADREITKADIDVRAKLDRLKFSLEHEHAETPDDQLAQLWTDGSTKIIDAAAGTISAKKHREVWSLKAKALQEDGANWTQELTFKRQVDKSKAETVATIADLSNKAGDLTMTRDTFVGSVKEQRDFIRRQTERGFYDKESAAQLNAKLDEVENQDHVLRSADAVETLVRAGDEAKANEIIASVSNFQDQKRLREMRDATKQDMRVEKNIAETENNKRMTANAEALDVGILEGKAGPKAIYAAREKGDIDDGHVGSLLRSYRSEQNRRETEAKLSAAEKEALSLRSDLNRLTLKSMPPATFVAGPQNWPPEAQQMFQEMKAADKVAILTELQKRAETGATVEGPTKIYGQLANIAKRYVPNDWKLNTDIADGEGNGFKFSGQLMKVAERLAKERGAESLTPEEARFAVSEAFRAAREYDAGPAQKMSKEFWAQFNTDAQAASGAANAN